MMENKFIGLAVGLTVGVILLSGFLWPIVSDATATEKTFTNDEYFISMDKVLADDTETHTITWSGADRTKIVVDGVDVIPTWDSITIVAEEDNLIRCTKAAAGYYLNMVGVATATGVGNGNDQSITITISNGSIVFAGVTSSSTNYSVTSTFETAYIINPANEGEYSFVLKTPAAKAYVKADSEIYGIGYSNIGGAWQNVFSIHGTIADGVEVDLVSTTLEDSPVISNENTVYSEVEGYIGLYQFEKETFTATYDSTDTALTYSYVIVPAKVTAELSNHLDTTQVALVAAIGTLGAIVLIAAAAGSIRRLD